MASGERESERKGNPPFNTSPSPLSGECANSTVEEVNEPVPEMALRGAAIACYPPPPAFCPKMDPSEWLDKVEDFFFISGVPPSHYAASARLLMTEAVRRKLFPPGSTRYSSWQELKHRLLDVYGQSESPIRLEMRFSGLRQRKDQSIRDFAREVAEVGRRAGKSECELVSRFILGLASKEVYRELCLQEPATLKKARQLAEIVTEIEEDRRKTVDDASSVYDSLAKTVEALARRVDKLVVTWERQSRLQPTRRTMECFECGGLGHFRRDCPQRRTRTRTARAPSSGTRDRRLLAMDKQC